MKKAIFTLGIIGGLLGMFSIASASSTSCKEVEFSNGVKACVNIENVSSSRRELSTEITSSIGSTSNLKCDLLTPDNELRSVASCNGQFTYSNDEEGRIKLWIRYSDVAPSDWEDKPSSASERTYPQWIYDFDNEERTDDNINNDDNNDGDTDNFYISASPSDPDEDEEVDITIKARDGSTTDDAYRGTVRFKVEKKSGSSRTTASSSYYELDRTSYTFTSSDDGEHEFSNLVTFKNDSYEYRLVAYDDDDEDIEGTKTFTMGNSSSSTTDTDNFYVTTDDTTPSISQRVDLTIKARDGTTTDTEYEGSVEFEVYYRSSSSSSWTKTTSSTYYEIDTDYEDGYDFTSSNNGQKTLTDFIKFKKNNYEYKIVVIDQDDNDIDGYKEFDVGSTSSSTTDTDNFYVTTDDATPSISQRVDLTIKARDGTTVDTEYEGSVEFEVYYRSSSSSSWTKTTSSTYYEMDTDYEDGYDFTSSNNGQKTLTDFIKLKKNNYEYKIVVIDQDDNDIDGYKTFDVGSSSTSSNGDLDNFYLTADDTTPSTSQYVDLTIKARDANYSTITDYTDSVNFKVYYRSSSSSSWTETTSSTYYEIDTDYDDGYDFTSSDDGIAELTDFIKFKKTNYEYKVRVYAEDESTIYKEIIFDVNGTSSTTYDTDNFYITTDDTTPSTSQYVDLTIKARDGTSTDTSYRGSVEFEVYYRSSSSSSWIKTTSSTYYTMNSSYTNGYTFTSSNAGQKIITDFIRFNRNNYEYKVVVMDEDDNDIDGYKEFDVGSTSSSTTDTDNFYVTSDDTTPSTTQYVDLTIKARDGTTVDTEYEGSVEFEVYYRSSSSSSWTKTTSSTYYEMDTDYEDGYDFTSSNNGQKTLTDFIKFKKDEYEYKVIVMDSDDNDIDGYVTFDIGGSSSSTNGFTSSELDTVESMYDRRENVINDLEDENPDLINNSRRQNMSDDLYTAMQEIVDDEDDKTYDNFDDFYNAFLDWYRYTISAK